MKIIDILIFLLVSNTKMRTYMQLKLGMTFRGIFGSDSDS